MYYKIIISIFLLMFLLTGCNESEVSRTRIRGEIISDLLYWQDFIQKYADEHDWEWQSNDSDGIDLENKEIKYEDMSHNIWTSSVFSLKEGWSIDITFSVDSMVEWFDIELKCDKFERYNYNKEYISQVVYLYNELSNYEYSEEKIMQFIEGYAFESKVDERRDNGWTTEDFYLLRQNLDKNEFSFMVGGWLKIPESSVSGDDTKSSQVTEEVKNATVLKDAFQNDFTVGAAILMSTINSEEQMAFIGKYYNRITMGNELKPDSLLDGPATEESEDGMPEIKTENLDKILKTVQENGLKLRGHCLVWHNQTPHWFFSKDYEPSKGLVDKETMKQRMEAYIKKVLTYCQENYPGVIYAWDVVNEAMGDDGGYRTDSNWYRIYGDESYITDAFTFARKYAGEDVKLFYNDYNEYVVGKTELIVELLTGLREKGLVDGMGMQSHWDMDFPSVNMLKDALEAYGKIDGLEIQMTEIDMHNTDNSEEGLERQAERYKDFFEEIVRAKRTGTANITNVTFWGMTDEGSWLNVSRGEISYPLLFDKYFQEKPCYQSVMETAKEEYWD